MKNFYYIIFVFISVIGCSKYKASKPNTLLEKEQMIAIIYDISILQAARSHSPQIVDSSYSINEYIYKKYKIDSITLLENQRYYASNPKEFRKMYKQVQDKVLKEIETKK